MLTLNSQQEYLACEAQLQDARRGLVIGAGLIGTELAMDFCRAGKAVTLADCAASVLPTLLPPEVSGRLQHCLVDIGTHLLLKAKLQSLEQTEKGIRARFDGDRISDVDVVVDSTLQTSQADIYALDDCAEIAGQVRPFLQPIQLSYRTGENAAWR